MSTDLELDFWRKTITDVLGRERTVERVWPDGSYNCPFCFAAVKPEHEACPNPACFANPRFPIDVAKERLAAQVERDRAESQRKDLEQWRRQYAEERRQEDLAKQASVQSEAVRRGACVRCALKSYASFRLKYVRHRKQCPLER